MSNDMEVLVLAMRSPGGRNYQFSMIKNQENMNLLKDKKEMANYLEELKKQGLNPQEKMSTNQKGDEIQTEHEGNRKQNQQIKDSQNAKPSSSSKAFTKSATSSTKIASVIAGTSTTFQHPSYEDSDDDYETEEDINSVASDVIRSKRQNRTSATDASAPKRGKAVPKKPPAKASTKKWKDLRVQHYVKGEKNIFEVERAVIEEVLKRPPLFDWRLSPKQRAPDLLFNLRLEIAEIVNEIFDTLLSTDAVENTFNYYRAQYVQFANASKALPSGSGSNRLPKEPKHYEVLQQLDYLYDRREQFSSTSAAGFDLIPPQGRGKGKGKKDEEVGDLMKSANQLLTTIHKQATTQPPPPTPPPPPQTNSVSLNDPHFAFFFNILPDFRKLNPSDKREFKIMVSDILNKFINEYDDEDDSSVLSNAAAPPINASDDHHHAFFLTILPDFRKLKRKDKREFKIKVMQLLNDYLKKD